MARNLNILHLFNTYLPVTENWCYHLIKNTPGVKSHISYRQYLNNKEFRNDQFVFCHHRSSALRTKYLSFDKMSFRHFFMRRWYKFLMCAWGREFTTIEQYLADQSIDLIHLHFADVAWYFRSLYFDNDIPIVVSFYGWDYEALPFQKPEYNAYYKRLFQRADRIICEGNFGKSILINLGCPQDKIRVVALGVEIDKIKYSKKCKQDETLKLVQIASFTQKKGQLDSVKALHKALSDCPNLSLHLIGPISSNNTYLHKVKDYVTRHSLSSNVQFLDAINFNDLHTVLSDYDVFIHPSQYADDRDCEGGAPIVILDAQAVGLPIISTTHCDIPSEVLDKNTGLLVSEKDVDKLADCIRTFYNMRSDRYITYSTRAREHVTDHYDIRHNALMLKTVYDDIFLDLKK